MLSIGDHIKLRFTSFEAECVVQKTISKHYFEVLLNDFTYILKWFYTDGHFYYDYEFYKNMENNFRIGSPDNRFLWPIAITDYSEQGFGYLIETIPENYICMTDWVSGRVQIQTQILIRVALNLVCSLHSLSSKGLYGFYFHDNSIFFDPKSGDLLIRDIEELKPEGLHLSSRHTNLYDDVYSAPVDENEYLADSEKQCFRYGIKRYQAPETVLDYSVLNLYSDRYSLSALLFMLFYKTHPLEGEKTRGLILSQETEDDIYGKNPLFIFDPIDNSNAPYGPISIFTLKMWRLTPKYVKTVFETAFSQTALKKPNSRPNEWEWLKCLARWDAEIEKCDSCGFDFTGEAESVNACPFCGNKNSLQYYIELDGNCYTAQKGNKIRRCLASIHDSPLSPVAVFVSKKDNKQILGIKNCSRGKWLCINGDKKKLLEPGQIIRLFNGLSINTSFGIVKVYKKKEINPPNGVSLQNMDLQADEIYYERTKKKEMHVVFVVDRSKSMKGIPINRSYNFIENVLINLQKCSEHQSGIEVKYSIMEFNTRINWVTGNTPLSIDDEFFIEYPCTGGISDIGGALKGLNERLDNKYLMSDINVKPISPIIIFLTDGCEPFSFYGYNWEKELQSIQTNKWFKIAAKYAVRISEDCDYTVLEKLTGTRDAIFEAEDLNFMESILHSHSF